MVAAANHNACRLKYFMPLVHAANHNGSCRPYQDVATPCTRAAKNAVRQNPAKSAAQDCSRPGGPNR
eukprot:1162014-Pelagomonas_calceolata.AAC.1